MFIDANIARVLLDGLQREGWNHGTAKARALASDRGGLTRGGITATAWGAWRNLGRPAMAAELDAITESEALEFYFHNYVTVPRFDRVLDQKLRAVLIDWSFTSWFDDPVKALQSSLRARSLYRGAIDGVIGAQTIAALQADRDPRRLFRDVYAARLRFYVALALDEYETAKFIADRPTSQLRNLAGWVNRALEFTP